MILGIRQARSKAKVTVAHNSPMIAWLDQIEALLRPPQKNLGMSWDEWTKKFVTGQTPEKVVSDVFEPTLASVNHVFVVQERHELDGAAWFEPVIAYFDKARADAEAARRQEIALKAFVESGVTDEWQQPAHEVKQVMMGGL